MPLQVMSLRLWRTGEGQLRFQVSVLEYTGRSRFPRHIGQEWRREYSLPYGFTEEDVFDQIDVVLKALADPSPHLPPEGGRRPLRGPWGVVPEK